MSNESDNIKSNQLTDNFFRNEYGKMVSVVTRYLGINSVEQAEDIVQETLLKATESWNENGIPENPQAWLYTAAKNLTLNILKRKKVQQQHYKEQKEQGSDLHELSFSDETIADEQLKMMFTCCHPSISENSQIALILKILCGFSITEISSAFFSTNETINKRLVRGRKSLRKNEVSLEISHPNSGQIEIVLKTIYLLFNEGYSPTQKNELVRFDLCLEAIRLVKILIASKSIKDKSASYALLALMQLNASRFAARTDEADGVVAMENQDRSKWSLHLINQGVKHLNHATDVGKVSKYLILATISANHAIAKEFQDTDWKEILALYDTLLTIEDSPAVRLNRAVALSKVKGSKIAIAELQDISAISDIENHYLYHATLSEMYKQENNIQKATEHLKTAMTLTKNPRDLQFLEKKIINAVPKS